MQIFTDPHADYHRPGDTADKIDGPGLVKVATFVKEGIAYLGERRAAAHEHDRVEKGAAPPRPRRAAAGRGAAPRRAARAGA